MKKILIIDDDQIFQKTMSDKLVLLNYEVSSATNGEDGLARVVSDKPDLILLDLKMPKMDGISFLKTLHVMKDTPKIPILITSNLSRTQNIADGIALGVRGYIVKSDESLDTIVKAIESTLNSVI